MRSFASSYRCQYLRFRAFLWLVYYSARNVNASIFSFFKGSWIV